MIASLFGIPTSESHSLIAGLSGAAIAIQSGIGGINMDEWVKVLYGLAASLVIGFAMGWVVCKAGHGDLRRHGPPPAPTGSSNTRRSWAPPR